MQSLSQQSMQFGSVRLRQGLKKQSFRIQGIDGRIHIVLNDVLFPGFRRFAKPSSVQAPSFVRTDSHSTATMTMLGLYVFICFFCIPNFNALSRNIIGLSFDSHPFFPMKLAMDGQFNSVASAAPPSVWPAVSAHTPGDILGHCRNEEIVYRTCGSEMISEIIGTTLW